MSSREKNPLYSNSGSSWGSESKSILGTLFSAAALSVMVGAMTSIFGALKPK